MKDSHIQWTNHTFNPWEGCTKVSPGCLNCYAEARNVRFSAGKNWGKGAPRRRTSVSNWKEPVKWNQMTGMGECVGCGKQFAPIVRAQLHDAYKVCDCGDSITYSRPRVFCASLADWLDDEVPIEWLTDLLKLIHETPNLDWLLLTKRPGNWRDRIFAAWRDIRSRLSGNWQLDMWVEEWLENSPPANIWIGTTVEDQQRADERIPALLKIPARVRFLSCEPLLEKISLTHGFKDGPQAFPLGMGIQWIICGGESGSGARVFDVDWARSLRDQCSAAGVPFFMKQMGQNVMGREMDKWVTRLTKKSGDAQEWPEELRVRQFPNPVHA